MASLSEQLSRLVYSTEQGRLCPECSRPMQACRCREMADAARAAQPQGPVRLSLETKGRRGKGVTVLGDLVMDETSLRELLRTLKNRCGAGGALKDGALEIQGDHRDAVQALLQERGLKVKRVGRP